jgi:hypothetical protein
MQSASQHYAWSSLLNGTVEIIEIETKQKKTSIQASPRGIPSRPFCFGLALTVLFTSVIGFHLKSLAGGRLLASLVNDYISSSSLQVFDVSQQEKANIVFSHKTISEGMNCRYGMHLNIFQELAMEILLPMRDEISLQFPELDIKLDISFTRRPLRVA